MEEIDLSITALSSEGQGIAKRDNFTFFVTGALPGEEVTARITQKKKTYARAETLKILTPSQERVIPPCPLFGSCGGCQLQHLSYKEQLTFKKTRVVDALERIGKLKNIDVEACEPSLNPFHYRNKIQVPTINTSGNIVSGFYACQSHHIIDMEVCLLHTSLGQEVYSALRNILQQFSLAPPFVTIKTSLHEKKALVIFTAEKVPLNVVENIFSHPLVKGVCQIIPSSNPNKIFSDTIKTLKGDSILTEKLLGLEFSFGPLSFFQVNPPQAEKLLNTARAWVKPKKHEILLDAYCGVGTFSLVFSSHVAKTIGIECVSEAIKFAQHNAQINGSPNTEFHTGHAEHFLNSYKDNIDIVVMNPPRKGADPLFLEALLKKKPKKILYMSCDPATLARDLAILTEQGNYKIKKIKPFDMFPQTHHVETLAYLVHHRD